MAVMPLAGTEFAGYRLVWVASKGDVSTLFLAEDPYLGTVIALKVLDPSLADDDTFRTRFLEESRLAASMNHPNVIPVHDIGSSDGLLYIAMRCVTGTDLRQMLQESGPLPADRSLFLIGQAARALDAAHRHGLVHRDIKPANLLVEPGADGSGPDHLYVTDFGITGQLASADEGCPGTLGYLAPEQVARPSGRRSRRPVLARLRAVRMPDRLPSVREGSRHRAADQRADQEPVPPTVLRPDLPPAIDEVFARVLAANPGDRFENCREFVTAARRALGPLADPRAAGGSPLLRPVSYPAPPHGPVLASPVLRRTPCWPARGGRGSRPLGRAAAGAGRGRLPGPVRWSRPRPWPWPRVLGAVGARARVAAGPRRARPCRGNRGRRVR